MGVFSRIKSFVSSAIGKIRQVSVQLRGEEFPVDGNFQIQQRLYEGVRTKNVLVIEVEGVTETGREAVATFLIDTNLQRTDKKSIVKKVRDLAKKAIKVKKVVVFERNGKTLPLDEQRKIWDLYRKGKPPSDVKRRSEFFVKIKKVRVLGVFENTWKGFT